VTRVCGSPPTPREAPARESNPIGHVLSQAFTAYIDRRCSRDQSLDRTRRL
jgi:hypothetical protein